ncbi:MAG: type III pantothenate kinase [Gammaproteobacteria bacterium]|nr:type III pantothenate kinase [Gammaproteobacteria bacterium]
MDILLDMGNRRIKWAKSIDMPKLMSGKYAPAQQERLCHVINFAPGNAMSELDWQFRAVPRPDSVWVSCVGDSDAMAKIERVCQGCWNIQPNFVASTDNESGIKNGYLETRQLGVDRWLAMIAARHFMPDRPLLVIDAGTAITIDFIDATGLFKGGMIVPGLMTIMESLNQTAGLPLVDSDVAGKEHITLQNQDTHSAIANGALHTAVSAIENAVSRYEKECGKHLGAVITGGDATLINRISKYGITEFPALPLIGLFLVTRDHDC